MVASTLEYFLKQHNLSHWWAEQFTADDTELASTRFMPMGFERLNMTDRFEPNETTETPQAFLRSLAGWFRKSVPAEASIRLRIEAKASDAFDAAERSGDTRPAEGIYRGRHYTEYVEPLKQLKRDGRLDEAATTLSALLPIVLGEAAAAGWTAAPWYFEQLSIIESKRGNWAGAVEACDAYLAAPRIDHENAAAFRSRRAKALLRLRRDG